MTEYYCKYCDYRTIYKGHYKRHNSTESHKNMVLTEEWELPNEPTADNEYRCYECDFVTVNKYNYDRHMDSINHHKRVSGEIYGEKSNIHCCLECNKEYSSASGLWRHKKKCYPTEKDYDKEEANTFVSNRELVEFLLKENKEFKQIIVDQGKQMLELAQKQAPHTQNNTTNNNNQKFNLNFFLNETCKDAINFKDFMNSIQVTLLDLEKTAQLGYVDGISRIFIDALKNTDVEHRPIHCTDTKRDSVYIKDGDKWDKDTNQRKLKHAVNYISDRNLGQIQHWKKENPEWMDSGDPKSEVLSALYVKSMATNPERDETKIIHNILNNVVVEKEGSY